MQVWGLAQGTRDHRCRIIRRLLKTQFGSGSIYPTSISPSTIRSFRFRRHYMEQEYDPRHGGRGSMLSPPSQTARRQRHRSDARCASTCVLGSNQIVRGTFWERTGTAFPVVRRGLSIATARLCDGPMPCRSLGLRSSEVVRLSLDDIDWQAGTIRITLGKGRRADVLPLPGATGEAIADYLLHERPKTTCRQIFVRHVAPLGEPVGRRVVQKAVHAAYQRLGWDRTRVHILRHTLATRVFARSHAISPISIHTPSFQPVFLSVVQNAGSTRYRPPEWATNRPPVGKCSASEGKTNRFAPFQIRQPSRLLGHAPRLRQGWPPARGKTRMRGFSAAASAAPQGDAQLLSRRTRKHR